MASFSTYKPTLLRLEGGYQDDPRDIFGNFNSKGELIGTNFGISAPTLERWLGYAPTLHEMKFLNKETAFNIHEAYFWNAMRANEIIDQALAELIVDHGVNAGVNRATKMLQEILNSKFSQNLVVDGILGTQTIATINRTNSSTLFREYANARSAYYHSLNKPHFIKSWTRRISIIATKFGKAVSNNSNVLIPLLLVSAIAFGAYKYNQTKSA